MLFQGTIIILGIQVIFDDNKKDICNSIQVVIIMFISSHNVILIVIQLIGGLMEGLVVLVCLVCCMNMDHLYSRLTVIKFNLMNGLGIKNQMFFISKHLEE